ncbi:hypothetical protein Adt_41982 [Abeliophyllum distichum]|uniref:Uncharacterized protein n=1 Tax=Abeliophyllum distichum TaxID=126358 RepID=A0ABD1PQD9_9LAMI
MLSNPSTTIVMYRKIPRILIPDSEHRLGEHEPVDIVMSNQLEHFVETCSKDQVGESFAILLEDEIDGKSPKGRGQRKMRKGKALCTPWTNPLKRRKFKNLTIFYSFREVDPAKQLVENAYQDRIKPVRNNLDEVIAKMLVHYVEEATTNLEKTLKICRYLYFPYCVPNSQCFAVEIDLEEQRINIFDSFDE